MRVSIPPIYAITGLQIDGDVDFLDTYKLLRLSAPATGGALRKGKAEIINADVKVGADIVPTKIFQTAITRALLTTQGDVMVRGATIPERLPKPLTGQYFRATDTGYEGVTAYTQAEVDAILAAHAALATVHQDAPALIATHAAIATAHQDAPALIATHAGVGDVHHTKTIPEFDVSDALLTAANTERNTNSETYVKLKEITLVGSGALRIKFDLKAMFAGDVCRGRVYRNGEAVGTEQTNNTTDYVTKSEDISGWSFGDKLQLYALTPDDSAGHVVYIQNFQLYGNLVGGSVDLD